METHGEFYPYAVVVETDGQQVVVTAYTGQDRPASSDLVTELTSALSEQRHELRAAAIVADVRLPQAGSDAILVMMEHSEGIALTLFLPYRIRRFRGTITYGEHGTETADPSLWLS